MSDTTDIEDPHVEAWEVRQTDPAFTDGTVASPGTEYPPEPGPGPVDEEGNPVDPSAPPVSPRLSPVARTRMPTMTTTSRRVSIPPTTPSKR
jgi:hypothetical protein